MTISNNLTFKAYQNLIEATKQVLEEKNTSKAYFDFTRSSLAREAGKLTDKNKITESHIKSYLANAINPYSGFELTEKEYNSLYKIYGDAVVKIHLIDQNFKGWLKKSDNEKILSAGGACALEDVDLLNIKKLINNLKLKSLVGEYITTFLDISPTWTQITGALIPAYGVSVLYDETYPWFLKIRNYGVENAEILTQKAYDKIYNAVYKFSKLINPNNIVLKIPFTKLDLVNKGYLQKWFYLFEPYVKNIDAEFNLQSLDFNPEEFIKGWVEYTYCGPDILNLNKSLIQELYPDEFKKNKMNIYSIHVRGKQIDHLTMERDNYWMNELILRKSYKALRVKKLLETPAVKYQLAIYKWQKEEFYKYKNIGFAGTLDFNYEGNIMHETSLVNNLDSYSNETDQLVRRLLRSPLRLNSQNVERVLDFLSYFTCPNSVTFSKDLLTNFLRVRLKFENLERKINKLKRYIKIAKRISRILSSLTKNKLIITYKLSKNYTLSQEDFQLFINRYKNNTELLMYLKKFNTDEVLNLNELLGKIILEEGVVPNDDNKMKIIFIFPQEIVLIKTTLIKLLNKNSEKDKERMKEISSDYIKIKKEHDILLNKVVSNLINHKLNYPTDHISILPLINNIFFSYMQQLLFIPSVSQAYLHMVKIEKHQSISKSSKEEIIIEITKRIYPVIAEIIRYIMLENKDYPWALRFESQYKEFN